MAADEKASAPAVIIAVEWRDYHIARLRAAQQYSSVPLTGLELFGRPAEAQYYIWHAIDREGVQIDTLFPDRSGRDMARARATIRRAVRDYLSRLRPSVVIVTGYSELAMRVAAAWARDIGVPAILLSASTHRDRRRFRPLEALKGWWIRRHFNAAFTSGTRSAAYLGRLGFDQTRTWRGYGVVDNAAFAAGAATARKTNPSAPDTESVIPPYFLYVGRLSGEKNVSLLLRSYRLYRDRAAKAWGLTLVGAGPHEFKLKSEAQTLGLSEIEWAGFRSGPELHPYYAKAGALVLPSRSEPWGLVVNEAMACGVPILASDRCGCAPDLVHDGVNGYVFGHRDPAALAELMTVLASQSCDDLKRMGVASTRIISSYAPDSWGRALTECINFVLSPSRAENSA